VTKFEVTARYGDYQLNGAFAANKSRDLVTLTFDLWPSGRIMCRVFSDETVASILCLFIWKQ